MSGTTEEQIRFKKVHQVVGGGSNNDVVGNSNDEAMKTFGGSEQNIQNDPRTANSKQERELSEKGYTTRPSDEELDESQELREKLSKRGNPS